MAESKMNNLLSAKIYNALCYLNQKIPNGEINPTVNLPVV